MKQNDKGFVVSAVLYPLLILFLALIMGLLSMSDTRKRILDKMKLEISDSVFDEATCSCDTILNKLNYIIKNGVAGGGGSSFGNISVTAYETPTDVPAKGNINDIAVITTNEITSYEISNDTPSALEGKVWIKLSSNYRAIIISDTFRIPIYTVYQYLDGQWQMKRSFMFGSDANWIALQYSEYYTEELLNGADPELYQGLIPIDISASGAVTVVDPAKKWFSYENKQWANAVLVTNGSNFKVGDIIPETNILMYYVWVPRYKYKLFNVTDTSIAPQQIDVVFEGNKVAKSKGTTNGSYLTHQAFTFGTTELNGMWIGKFEPSGSVSALRIKPGISSLRNINVSSMFNASRNIDLTYSSTFGLNSGEIDTHMMKNMEWGAVAYLSHSKYGTCTNGVCKEITYNSNSSYYTGGTNSSTAYAATYFAQSTTLNRYGIYDTSGGAWEYVMGNMTTSATTATSNYFYNSSAGFSAAPEDKYIDYYTNSSSEVTHARGKIGDATKETLNTFGSNNGGWYGDYAYFPNSSYAWFVRGGQYANGATLTGVFAFDRNTGEAYTSDSFRVVLSAD